ncbi:MAG TPA: hypothetical protein VK892_06460 [Pyrinomonadaceae bacterium]|nr:hypothetical protein [Pyrinomonadaceae bacterium]
MKAKFLIIALTAILSAASCQTTETDKTADTTNKTNTETATKSAPASTATPEFTGEYKFPFADFPAAKTTAQAGEKVLVPSFRQLDETMQKDIKDVVLVWDEGEMVKPGDEKSEIKMFGKSKEVPNAYIIPIPPSEKAKKGDILLTRGLDYEIVVGDGDPTKPVTRRLSARWDDKDKENYSQKEFMQEPGTFIVLTKEMQPGAPITVEKDGKTQIAKLIRAEGDKVFASIYGGRTGVFPKSQVKPIPLKPSVKEGDKIMAESFSQLKPATVTKVDQEIGRVWVKFDDGKEEVLAYGDFMPAT